MEEVLQVEKGPAGLMKIRLNRPEKRNAVNEHMMNLLDEALDEASADQTVKAVLIEGAGSDAFCSGGDLAAFRRLQTELEAARMLEKMCGLLYRTAVLPKPVIAHLNGSAFGGGCELAAACDIRIAEKGIKIGFIQGTLGITTGWGGASLLYEKLSPSQALRMLLGAKRMSGEEAAETGFIDILINDPADVNRQLEEFLDKEAGVLAAYKRILADKWEKSGLRERMLMESRQCARLWESDAHHAAVDRFLKRKSGNNFKTI